MLCAICYLLGQFEFQKDCYSLSNILWPLRSQSVRQISPVQSLFCGSLYSHVCELNLFWKVLENLGICFLQVLESPGKQYFTVCTNPVFTFLVSVYPDCPGKKAVKQM